MHTSILITGATDGIGLATAKLLAASGHELLLHGRSSDKLQAVTAELEHVAGVGKLHTFVADLSSMAEVASLAEAIAAGRQQLGVLINNAGVLRSPQDKTVDGLDTRFAVNCLAPYLLTRRLLPLLDGDGRVVNLSSAAQASIDMPTMLGQRSAEAMQAYSQSKLGITAWTRALAQAHPQGPALVAVNPGSLLASKMVKEGFGIAGSDLSIGANILVRAATSDEFATASGLYFDNDNGGFADPHPDALDADKSTQLLQAMDELIQKLGLS